MLALQACAAGPLRAGTLGSAPPHTHGTHLFIRSYSSLLIAQQYSRLMRSAVDISALAGFCQLWQPKKFYLKGCSLLNLQDTELTDKYSSFPLQNAYILVSNSN